MACVLVHSRCSKLRTKICCHSRNVERCDKENVLLRKIQCMCHLLSQARISIGNSNIQTTSKPQNKLGLRFLFLLLVSLPPFLSILYWQLLPFRASNWTHGSLITSQACVNGVQNGCSSVLRLFYQICSVFIQKERRNEEMKGGRRGRSRKWGRKGKAKRRLQSS